MILNIVESASMRKPKTIAARPKSVGVRKFAPAMIRNEMRAFMKKMRFLTDLNLRAPLMLFSGEFG